MVSESIYKKVINSYGDFFQPLCLLPKEKIAHDVLDEIKIHDQINILCRSLHISPADLKGKKILEVGSGLGIFVAVTRRDYGMESYGIEPAEIGFNTSYSICQEIMEEYNLDKKIIIDAKGENIPFDDNSFDLVFSSTVLEHVDNPYQVLKESIRVLKSGGYLHFAYPNHHAFFDGHYAVFHPPLWLQGKFFPWMIKHIYGRDPAFAKTIRTELNIISTQRMLKKLSKEFRIERISLGKEIFKDRMQNMDFNDYAGLGKIKAILITLKKLRLNILLAKILIFFKMWDPVIISIKKK